MNFGRADWSVPSYLQFDWFDVMLRQIYSIVKHPAGCFLSDANISSQKQPPSLPPHIFFSLYVGIHRWDPHISDRINEKKKHSIEKYSVPEIFAAKMYSCRPVCKRDIDGDPPVPISRTSQYKQYKWITNCVYDRSHFCGFVCISGAQTPEIRNICVAIINSLMGDAHDSCSIGSKFKLLSISFSTDIRRHQTNLQQQ